MLVMRDTQVQAFEKVAVDHFQQALLAHVRTFFPRHAEVLGPAQLARVIHHALQKTARRNLKTERAVFLYTGLLLMLGSEFDKDPQLPWAIWRPEPVPSGEAAGEAEKEQVIDQKSPDVRIEGLYSQAMKFLDRAVGAENQFLQRTVDALCQARIFDEVPSAPSFGHRLLLLLQMLGPERYRVIGEGPLRELVRHGYESAKRYGMVSEREIMHYMALAFVLGSGFVRDPLYPWAGSVLSSPTKTDGAAKGRGAALWQAALEHLSRCLPACPRRAEQSTAALARPNESYNRIIEG
ncbi:MAG: hypothetical protein ABTR07_14105 [Candidatus Competibacter denitrificans]